MATVKKFDDVMIEAFLKKADCRYLKDSDGDYVVHFRYADETQCEITLHLIKGGTNKEVLSVTIASDAEIPKSELGAALFFCNTWNKERRWPKAYVVHKDNDSHGRVLCEGQIDLEEGIHQELFDDFATTIVAAGTLFWKVVAEEKPFTFKR